jgi:hypothetical protein
MSRDSLRRHDPTRWVDDDDAPVAQPFPMELLQDHKTTEPLNIEMMPEDAEQFHANAVDYQRHRDEDAVYERDRAAVRAALDDDDAPISGLRTTATQRATHDDRDPRDERVSLGELTLGLHELPADIAGALNLRAEGPLRAIGRGAYDTVFGGGPIFPGLMDVEYSPSTLGYESVPFSDEISGTVDAFANDRPISDAVPEAREHRRDLRERNPGSALAGTIGQGLALSPLLSARAAAGASRAAPTLWNAVRSGAVQGAREGALYGGLSGADESEASVLSSGSDILSGRTAPLPGLAELGNDALELGMDTGAGAGVGAGVGGVFGGGMGAVGSRLRTGMTGVTPEAEAAAEVEARRRAIAEAESVDDAFTNYGASAHPSEHIDPMAAPSSGAAGFRGLSDAAEQPIGLDDMAEAIRENPDIAHVRALGLSDRRQLRGAQNVFGMRGLADRADMYGLLRRGEIEPTNVVQQRAVALRDRAGIGLRDIADRFRSGGGRIDMRGAITEMEDLAARYRGVRDVESQAIADSIEADIRQIMEGEGNLRLPRGIDDATAVEPWAQQMGRASADNVPPTVRAAPPTMRRRPVELYDGPPLELDDDLAVGAAPSRPGVTNPGAPEFDTIPLASWDELQSMIRLRDQRNMGFLSGSNTAAPDARRQAGIEMRRILNRARDRAVRDGLGSAAEAEYRQLRDMFATSATVAPPNQLSAAQLSTPTLSRRLMAGSGMTVGAQIGSQIGGAPGAAVGGLGGGLAGYALGSGMRRYEWSVLAALNNAPGGVGAAVPDIANQLLARVRGRPGYEAASRMAGQDAVAAVREAAERIGDADVISLADEGLNLIGSMRRLPTMMRRAREALRVSPESFGRYAQPLLDSIRRGTFASVMADIQREDPDAAASIEQNVMDFAQAADEQTFRDPEAVQVDPEAPPVEGPDFARMWADEAYGTDDEPEEVDILNVRKTPPIGGMR